MWFKGQRLIKADGHLIKRYAVAQQMHGMEGYIYTLSFLFISFFKIFEIQLLGKKTYSCVHLRDTQLTSTPILGEPHNHIYIYIYICSFVFKAIHSSCGQRKYSKEKKKVIHFLVINTTFFWLREEASIKYFNLYYVEMKFKMMYVRACSPVLELIELTL